MWINKEAVIGQYYSKITGINSKYPSGAGYIKK